jgi:DNA-binding GntR family transcriptional regulator
VAGELEPGTVLRDAELAETLGLSRAPVRDALQRLAANGLVEAKPQSYTRVTHLKMADVLDATAVVGAMHSLAARVAVPRLSKIEIDAMSKANRGFARAVRQGDTDDALSADGALHQVLVDAAGNRALADTIDRYSPLIERVERQRFGSLAAYRSIHAHDELIRHCAAGRAGEAAAVTAAIWGALGTLLDDPVVGSEIVTPQGG